MLKTPPIHDNHIYDIAPPLNKDFMEDNFQIFNRFQLEVNMGKSDAIKIFDKRVVKKFKK